MRTLPLGVRIVALVIPLALLPIAFVGGVAYYYLEDAVRAEATNREFQTLEDADDLVNAALDEASRVADTVGRLLGATRASAPGAALAPSVQLGLALSPSVRMIAVVEPGAPPVILGTGGTTLGASPLEHTVNLPPLEGVAVPARLVAGSGRDSRVFVVNPVERSRARARVAVEIDLGWLSRSLADMTRAGGGSFYLANDRGHALVSSPAAGRPLPDGVQAALAAAPPTEPTVLAMGTGPEDHLHYAAPLGLFQRPGAQGSTALYLIRQTQRGALIDQIAELRGTAGLLAGAALALGLVGAGLIARTVVHPLNALLGMTKRIADGQFDVRLSKGRDDEIGQLVDAFNSMAASLETFRDRLVDAESFAAIGRVGSTLAHEVRNPLNAMRGCVDYLRLKRPDDPVVARHAGIIADEIAELDRFVRDFLRVARVEQPVLGAVSLHTLLESRLHLHEAASIAGAVRTVRDFRAVNSLVQADAQQVAMVFENLINNALEAMRDGGTLRVSTDDRPNGVRVTIEDTGLGIPPDVAGRIGTPFFTTKSGGTGLGLAISRRVVEAHGGRLWFEPATTVGAIFHVELPRGKTPSERHGLDETQTPDQSVW